MISMHTYVNYYGLSSICVVVIGLQSTGLERTLFQANYDPSERAIRYIIRGIGINKNTTLKSKTTHHQAFTAKSVTDVVTPLGLRN